MTAAKTVDEYGAQATSPTALPKSKVKIGSLSWKKKKYKNSIYIIWNLFVKHYFRDVVKKM